MYTCINIEYIGTRNEYTVAINQLPNIYYIPDTISLTYYHFNKHYLIVLRKEERNRKSLVEEKQNIFNK